jgi:hypothetical protein
MNSGLYAFATSTSEVLDATGFIASALAEYRREAALNTKEDIHALRVQQARINFVLQCDRSRVRDARFWATRDMASHWWPRLTLALFDASHGFYDAAESNLVIWAKSQPSYSRYMVLAYFHRVMRKPDEAAAAVEIAITYPIVDLPGDMMNTECRGYWAGIYAFGAGKYSTVVRLCDALLPVRENGDYAKAALRNLKAKALAAQDREPVQFEPSDQMAEYDPFDVLSLDALLAP